MERLFILYSTIDNSLVKKCHDRNYETLEQIRDMDIGASFEIELRDLRINKNEIVKTRKLPGKSKALTCFFQDLKNDKNYRLKPFFENHISSLIYQEEINEYLDNEEKAYGLEKEETWIIACESFVQMMGNYNQNVRHPDENILLEAWNKNQQSIQFEVPKDLLKQILNKIDYEMLICNAAGNSFYISDLGSTLVFNFFLVPFYYKLAKYFSDPDDEITRAISKYHFGLG